MATSLSINKNLYPCGESRRPVIRARTHTHLSAARRHQNTAGSHADQFIPLLTRPNTKDGHEGLFRSKMKKCLQIKCANLVKLVLRQQKGSGPWEIMHISTSVKRISIPPKMPSGVRSVLAGSGGGSKVADESSGGQRQGEECDQV